MTAVTYGVSASNKKNIFNALLNFFNGPLFEVCHLTVKSTYIQDYSRHDVGYSKSPEILAISRSA